RYRHQHYGSAGHRGKSVPCVAGKIERARWRQCLRQMERFLLPTRPLEVMSMPGLVEGKVALVTGGSSGIGRASARTFAREGARVMVADVAMQGGQETVHLIQEAGGEATFMQVDVTRAADITALMAHTMALYGRLDCAHNN